MFGRIFIPLIALTAGVASTLQAANQTTRGAADIPALIQALADSDSAVRRNASDQLSALPDARPQVIAALRSGDPEQRARAAEVLRRLPWFTPADSPQIQSTLQNYGAAPNDGMRLTIIARLADDESGAPILIRLLIEEPSEALRWRIVNLLTDDREINSRRYLRDAKFQKRLREIDVSQDDAPVLVVCGKAWLERDRARGLGLFRRAVDAELSHPASDHGVLAIAFDELIANHLKLGQFDQAAELLRRQVPRDNTDDRERWAVLESKAPSLAALVAMHRYFGPLRGWQQDLRTWRRASDDPPLASQRVADLMNDLGVMPPSPGMIGWQFELSAEDRLAAGEFLFRNKLYPAAEVELRTALAGAREDSPLRFTEYYASLLLARIAGETDRDAESVAFYERSLRAKLQANYQISDDDLQMQVHYRRARVARARGDEAGLKLEAQAMTDLNPASSDDTIAVIRWLKENQHADTGKAIFDKVFEQSKSQLDAEEFKAGLQNDIAWLCARLGEKIDLAVELSHAAIEAMPESAAFLDTAAEANFQKGNRDEAVRLETKALELAPDNDFMKEQLQRFKLHQP